MKKYANQDGYTLLLTLVIVVLLFLITATFTMASMNQQKQVVKTDDSFVAISLAEMGSEIIVPKVNQAIKSNQKDYFTCLSNKSVNCKSEFVSKVTSSINSYTATSDFINIRQVETNKTFSVADVTPLDDKIKIKIEGNSNGTIKTIDNIFNLPKFDNLNQKPEEVTSTTLLTETVKKCIEQNVDCDLLSSYNINLEKNHFTPKNHTQLSSSYYYLMNSGTFGQIFKGDGLSDVSLYANTVEKQQLHFDKHFKITSSIIEADYIKISHPPSQSYLLDSTIIAKNIQSDKSGFEVFGSSKICFKSTSTASIENIFDFYVQSKEVNGKNYDSSSVKIYYYSDYNIDESSETLSKTVKIRGQNVTIYGAKKQALSKDTFNSYCSIKAPALTPQPSIQETYLSEIKYN